MHYLYETFNDRKGYTILFFLVKFVHVTEYVVLEHRGRPEAQNTDFFLSYFTGTRKQN